MIKKSKSKIKYFDYSLLLMIILLICFGLVILYSTSAYSAQESFNNAFRFVERQALAIGIGAAAALFFVFKGPDFLQLKAIRILLYVVTIGLLVYVLINGANYGGSSRWIRIGPLNFQPSELAKFTVIVVMARHISVMPKQIKSFKTKFKLIMLLVPIGALIAVENLTTFAIVMGIGVFMILLADFNWKHFLIFALFAVVALVAAVFIQSYRSNRIQIWLNPESDVQGLGYQTMQALYAIGSGGIFGKGLGNGIQKLGSVPEAENDMIFSIICEELGLFGAVCVVLLFVVLLWRIMVVANNARSLYGSMICAGVFAQIAIQVVLNIAVVTNILPNTGVSLPFISYGGSSIIVLVIEMGMVLGVSRQITFDRPEVEEIAEQS